MTFKFVGQEGSSPSRKYDIYGYKDITLPSYRSLNKASRKEKKKGVSVVH